MDISKRFARSLALHRTRRGLTQAGLAHLVGTTPSYVGHLERGEREPSLTTLGAIAVALQVGVGELFVLTGLEGCEADEIQELRELMRGRSREDHDLVVRVARALFEDGRLILGESPVRPVPNGRRPLRSRRRS
ncbi:MAG: helix-turn-helix transcriptional regulator [Candidatus Wallbacteria bacterium]|nr:helix-turn-helix transcriptional regulator [Candidatus Wallbacteria bacterium]